ncbi:MAG: formate dehydrogenase subunit alpha, partial [Aquificales bacterium]|nr:formate dehydrogenase subunit alpha [Aquificales bacterium]
GKFNAVTAVDPAELPDEEYPLIMTTGRVLYHYHTGTQTRRSGPLSWVEPRGYVEVNAADAEAAGVADGRAIVVESRRGKVRTQLKVSDRVAPGTIFMSFHWREAPANMLTQDFKLDPVAKIPEYKICAVKLVNPRKKKK